VSSEICQDSFVFSSDDDSYKVQEENLLGTWKDGYFNEKNHEKFETSSYPSLYHNLMSKKGKIYGNSKNDTTPYSIVLAFRKSNLL